MQALQCVQAGSAERLAFSSDSKLLAVTSGSGLVLYDAQSLAQLRLFSVPTDEGVPGFPMLSVAFSPDGTLLASGSAEGRIWLWRVSDGSLLPTQSRHSDSVIALAFSADGATLASASYDSTVRIWRVPDGVLLRTLEGFERKRTHPEAAHCLTRVTFSPDGAVVAWACGRAIGLYRTVDGTRLRVLRMPEDVYTVAYSPDGTMLAAGSYERLRIWRLGARASTLLCEQDLGNVGAMAFSPNGQLLARGVTFFSIAESRDASPHPRSGQPGGSIRSVGFSPDGALLATGTENGVHCFWGLQPRVTATPLATAEQWHPARHGRAGAPGILCCWPCSAPPWPRVTGSPPYPLLCRASRCCFHHGPSLRRTLKRSRLYIAWRV